MELQILQDHVSRRYEELLPPVNWCQLPEIPSKNEIMSKADFNRKPPVEEWNAYQKDPVYDPKLPINIVDGPWPDKMAYLG